MTAVHFSSADLLVQYKSSKNKEEEALAIVRAFERFAEDQKLKMQENEMKVLQEINSKELATKADIALIRQELTHYATKKELVETVNHAVNTGKWQVIGAVAAMLFAEVALRHFGF